MEGKGSDICCLYMLLLVSDVLDSEFSDRRCLLYNDSSDCFHVITLLVKRNCCHSEFEEFFFPALV